MTSSLATPRRRRSNWSFLLPCAAALLGLFVLAGFPSSLARAGVPVPILGAWLGESPLPRSVQNAFRARLATDPQAREWLVAQDGQVFVLAYQPFSLTTHAAIRQARRGTSEMKARHLLLLYAVGEHYQRHGFSNREAIAKALTTVDTTIQGRLLPGHQSRAAVLDQGAVALVWTEEKRIAGYRQQLPPLDQFRPAYCRALYPTAQALFQERQYRQALAIYQDMHNLGCYQPTAYFLDAAECFLALQQPEDARRMANFLFVNNAASLSSSEAERAGDVLFAAGDEEAARQAYELAWSKLREPGHGDPMN